jgi:protein ImuA
MVNPFNMTATLPKFMFTQAFLPTMAGSVWRANELATPQGKVQCSGYAALDAQLPGGGWPVGTLTEVLLPHAGTGELKLLSSALSQLTQSGRDVVFIGAPHLPYGPALAEMRWKLDRLLVIEAEDTKDRLWACEQTLKSGGIGALVAWLPRVRADQLRRLQLAAMGADALLFVIRPLAVQSESSPAPLRLICRSAYEGESNNRCLEIILFKRRGPALERPLQLTIEQPVPPSQRSRKLTGISSSQSLFDFSAYLQARHALGRPRTTAAADRSTHMH